MRKKILTLSFVIFIILIGAYFFLLNENTNDSTAVEGPSPAKLVDEEEVNDGFSGYGSIEAIKREGKSAECKIWYEDEVGGESEGTVFVDGSDIRGDFITKSPDLSGEVVTSFVLSVDEFSYWSTIEGKTYGVRGVIDDEDVYEKAPMSPEDKVRYECDYWTNVDRSVFVPPSDVTWTDLSAIEASVMEYGTVYEESTPEF